MTQTKEASAEVVATLTIAPDGRKFLNHGACNPKIPNHEAKYLVLQSAYLALQEKVKELTDYITHLESMQKSLSQAVGKFTVNMEAKDAEPVGYVDKDVPYWLRSGSACHLFPKSMDSTDIPVYLTPPTVQAAVAAALRKAAEVCNGFMKDELYPTDFRLGASYCKQEILAIPADDSALRELMKVAKAAWEPDVVQDSDLEAIVDRIMK